jgi:hypothetical protein
MCRNIEKRAIKFCVGMLVMPGCVLAAEWSDTSISWRYGSAYREPYNNEEISKNILALTHVSAYNYGINFFNVDFLMSDNKDRASLSQNGGAQEAYIVYRNTLELGKLWSRDIKFRNVRDIGFTVGFDANAKNDIGYNSRKRMLLAGPTLIWDVPGFLNTSVLILKESNAPSGIFPPISNVIRRHHYKPHLMLTAAWGIPVAQNFTFEGFGNFIASKGYDEVGIKTAAETNIDMQLMWDVGAATAGAKNKFKLGIEYQYWRNKFGNPSHVPGSKASTPMIRAEYHF